MTPTLFGQDPRYFRMENGGVWRRSFYVMSRVVWTKDDIGELEFNGLTVLGDYTAAAISNWVYPALDRTWGQTIQTGSILRLEDSAFNPLKEFSPDVHNRRSGSAQSTRNCKNSATLVTLPSLKKGCLR